MIGHVVVGPALIVSYLLASRAFANEFIMKTVNQFCEKPENEKCSFCEYQNWMTTQRDKVMNRINNTLRSLTYWLRNPTLETIPTSALEENCALNKKRIEAWFSE